LALLLTKPFFLCSAFYSNLYAYATAKAKAKQSKTMTNVSHFLSKAVDASGLYGNDEAASKVAGHDLKGLISYFNLGIPDLHFPLMALVDYLGFRLIAMSLLPIDKSTLCYGTADGGKTIYTENAALNKKMQVAAEKLNLKAHVAGFVPEHSRLVWSAADVEGHEGKDGMC
jgi:Clustered mitochondria